MLSGGRGSCQVIRCGLLVLLAGCLPKRLTLDVPDWTVGPALPAQGPTVALAWPVDARPPNERTELGRYQNFNLPLVVYGDANLYPEPMSALDRTLTASLPAMGIPLTSWSEADYRVRVFVLHRTGTRDVSDANWVSTATGGIAGTLGRFVTPSFAMVETRVRLEISRRDGTVAAVRDVAAFRVEERPLGTTWPYWSLFFRSIHAEMFEKAFREVDADLGRDVALVIEQARREGPVVSGLVPDRPVYASPGEWPRPDTLHLGREGDAWDQAAARAKYGEERFSVHSGWGAGRHDLVGRFGYPAGNFGYDLGLADGVQLLLDLTVFGRLNGAGGGARVRLVRFQHLAAALEVRAQGDVVLFDPAPKAQLVGPWSPRFAGTTGHLTALVSLREGAFTPYARLGGSLVYRREAVEGDLLPDLSTGTAAGPWLAPGAELQIGPVVALAAELGVRRWWTAGDAGGYALAPQVTVGLR